MMKMEEVFIQILHNSIMAALLAMILILVKTVFKNKIGAKLYYLLWLVIAVRLIMPFDIPSQFSVFNLPGVFGSLLSTEVSEEPDLSAQTTKENQMTAVNTIEDLSSNASESELESSGKYSAGSVNTDNNSSQSLVVPNNTKNTSSEAAEHPLITENNWSLKNIWSMRNISFLWLSGVLLLFFCTFLIHVGFYAKIKKDSKNPVSETIYNRVLDECKSIMGITKNIKIVMTSEVKSPSLYGIFRIRLLLPADLIGHFDENELKHMIIHELSHYQRKDNLTNSLFVLIQIVHWFNPLVWYAFYNLREDCEVLTDEKTLTYIRPEEREKYGYTLIKLAAYFSKQKWIPASLNFASGKRPLTRRITMIKFFNSRSYRKPFIALIFVVLIGAVCLTSAQGSIKSNKDTPSSDTSDTAVKSNSAEVKANTGLSDSADNTAKSDIEASVNNDVIGIHGERYYYELHSVDFINSSFGWAIKDEFDYTDGLQYSKLVMTQDGGLHWNEIEIKDALIKQALFTDQNTGWAIAQSGNKATADGEPVDYEILYTVDSGKTWDTQLQENAVSPADCDIWFQDASHGYANLGGQLYATENGSDWAEITFPVEDFTVQHMSFTSAATGWVIGCSGQSVQQSSDNQSLQNKLMVLYTRDGGKTWELQFTKDSEEGPLGSIGISFINTETGWFLTSDLATWTGELYYTSDAGKNWEQINQIKCVRPTPTELKFISPTVGWIPLDVGAGPIAGGFLYTKDGGKNFSYIGSDYQINSVNSVDFADLQEGWAAGMNVNYGGYILHTADGGNTWNQVYPGISPTGDISFTDNRTGFGLGQLSNQKALLATNDGGNSWDFIYSFPDNKLPEKISFVDKSIGWALTMGESGGFSLLKTEDGGYTWKDTDENISQSSYSEPLYFHFLDQSNGILITRDTDNINYYKTKDGGNSWQLTKEKQSADSTYQFTFVTLEDGWKVDETRGPNQGSFKLWRTQNQSDWKALDPIGTNLLSYGLNFISDTQGWLLTYAQADDQGVTLKLMATKDGGVSWSSYDLPGSQLDTLQNQMPMQFTDDLHGWILTKQGLLKTQNGGKSWDWIN
jgi:beta-lactamase regulating signal transducer with metallopeptidase domain/photosystem II stability/assembly factor-like uncharacterized protein